MTTYTAMVYLQFGQEPLTDTEIEFEYDGDPEDEEALQNAADEAAYSTFSWLATDIEKKEV